MVAHRLVHFLQNAILDLGIQLASNYVTQMERDWPEPLCHRSDCWVDFKYDTVVLDATQTTAERAREAGFELARCKASASG